MTELDLIQELHMPKAEVGRYWLDMLLILGASIVVALVFFVWAKYFRRHKRHHSERRHLPNFLLPQPGLRPESSSPEGQRHRRRRKAQFRKRNPTLAETGGLPPVRTFDDGQREASDGPDQLTS